MRHGELSRPLGTAAMLKRLWVRAGPELCYESRGVSGIQFDQTTRSPHAAHWQYNVSASSTRLSKPVILTLSYMHI
jgi:hypothetical protein